MPNPTERREWPIIVGGCHRSGTSLVRRLLNGHPRIDCPPEVPFFRDFFAEYFEDPLRHLRFSAAVRSMVDAETALQVLGAAFVELHARGARSRGKQRWADKSPDNAIHLPHWERLLGSHLLYLHVVRNPLDTLASIAESQFPLTIPDSLEDRIAFYLRFTRSGLDWVRAHPDRGRVVVYERLVSRPAVELPALMQWLAEAPAAQQMEIGSKRHGSGLEDSKVSRSTTIHGESVGRWEQHFPNAEAQAILQATEPLWRELAPDLPLRVSRRRHAPGVG